MTNEGHCETERRNRHSFLQGQVKGAAVDGSLEAVTPSMASKLHMRKEEKDASGITITSGSEARERMPFRDLWASPLTGAEGGAGREQGEVTLSGRSLRTGQF